MRETLHSILNCTDYTSTNNVWRKATGIDTEYIFVKNHVNTCYYMPQIPVESRNMIAGISETISNVNKSICNSLKIFKRISVYREIEGMNFNSIYRSVFNSSDVDSCLKWISKDGTYYVCGNKIFDEGKKLLMFISENNKIVVDSSCINSDKWLEKYIASTFVPVYNEIHHSDVIFTDLSKYTPSFNTRHNVESMNNRLNDKLHYFSKTSYL